MTIMDVEPLELVRRFVNTGDVETGADDLSSPLALVGWLAEHSLVAVAERASASDVGRARDVREALRALLVANAGGPEPVGAFEILDRQALRSRVGLGFAAEGPVLRPAASGIDGALGQILTAVAAAMGDGSWPRLKACLADDCRWAFLDRSRNSSRHWCDMRVCGNRQKARVFRARHASR